LTLVFTDFGWFVKQGRLRSCHTLPLPPQEWLNALHRHTGGPPDKARSCTRDDEKGIATWTAAIKEHVNQNSFQNIEAVTWNANSFFKRLRTRGFADLLQDNPDLDIIHLTELRSALTL
jgi:hypothetical protein